MKVKDLTLGTMLDLENDPFTKCDDPECSADIDWQYEYGIVYSLEQETDDCVLVTFTNDVAIGFPVDHEVVVVERD